MIATCQICRQIVKPGAIILRQKPVEPVQRLCEAIVEHMAQFHRDEMNTALMASMNTQSLFMLKHVKCIDPKFLEIIAQSCGVLAQLLDYWSDILNADPGPQPEAENALQ